MGITTAPGMTSEEIVALSRAHTVFSWSVQGQVDPIAIDHAEGVYLYTPEGQKILDFNSQLMSVNIGHGDRRVIDAITAQATKLQFVQPAFTTEDCTVPSGRTAHSATLPRVSKRPQALGFILATSWVLSSPLSTYQATSLSLALATWP